MSNHRKVTKKKWCVAQEVEEIERSGIVVDISEIYERIEAVQTLIDDLENDHSEFYRYCLNNANLDEINDESGELVSLFDDVSLEFNKDLEGKSAFYQKLLVPDYFDLFKIRNFLLRPYLKIRCLETIVCDIRRRFLSEFHCITEGVISDICYPSYDIKLIRDYFKEISLSTYMNELCVESLVLPMEHDLVSEESNDVKQHSHDMNQDYRSNWVNAPVFIPTIQNHVSKTDNDKDLLVGTQIDKPMTMHTPYIAKQNSIHKLQLSIPNYQIACKLQFSVQLVTKSNLIRISADDLLRDKMMKKFYEEIKWLKLYSRAEVRWRDSL